jgi:4-diphosphocytidyl-2-C-methyl-D-erythritol kinase
MISFPNAKINLGLNILEKRSDGYHNISSCFYPVPINDVLEINLSGKFDFKASGISIPGNLHENLVVKAYKFLKKDFNLPDVAIHLHKNIPMEAGLGGGSSDGTFALKMLNEFFDLYLDDSVLEDYAGMLGSDCPFFIYNEPMLVGGRGEQMNAIKVDLKGYHICILKPQLSISTEEAYLGIKPAIPEKSIQTIITSESVIDWKDLLRNDFEESILEKYPELSGLKNRLYEMGAEYASLTGSGSAIYGLFSIEPKLKGDIIRNYFNWVGSL